jgi:hypothetical protein
MRQEKKSQRLRVNRDNLTFDGFVVLILVRTCPPRIQGSNRRGQVSVSPGDMLSGPGAPRVMTITDLRIQSAKSELFGADGSLFLFTFRVGWMPPTEGMGPEQSWFGALAKNRIEGSASSRSLVSYVMAITLWLDPA